MIILIFFFDKLVKQYDYDVAKVYYLCGLEFIFDAFAFSILIGLLIKR